MFWLIVQTWLLLLIAFALGCAVTWLVVRLVLPREADAFPTAKETTS